MPDNATMNGDSVRQYYKYTLEAEHYCIKKDFEKAAILYKKAFLYKSPFAADLYNLLLCSVDLKDYATVLNCSEQLVKKGASMEFFKQILFEGFKTSVEYLLLKAKYKDLHETYLSLTDQKLIDYLGQLTALDQNVHCALPVKHEDTAFVRSMHYTDDSLSFILERLMRENEFLDEDIIGAEFISDTVLSGWPLYGIIALHQIQRGGDIVTSVLTEAMRRGHLRSEIGLSWLSQTIHTDFNLTRSYIMYQDTLWKIRDENASLFRKVTGQTEGIESSVLYEIYLNDEYFNVEERVIYNFFSYCEKCAFSVEKAFLIAPRAMITGSVKEGHEAEFAGFLHNHYKVLATK